MKILFTSDLHGRKKLYDGLIRTCIEESVDAVILGGDLLPRERHLAESLNLQMSFVEENLFQICWHLRSETGAKVYAILGNDDWAATLPQFQRLEAEGLIDLLLDRFIKIDDDLFISGYSYIPPTPFSLKDFEKRDLERDRPQGLARHPFVSRLNHIDPVDEKETFLKRSSIEQDLAQLTLPEEAKRLILVFHTPPYGTPLDTLYDGSHVGSRAVRSFIEREQPWMSLHGHIHESPTVSGLYWDTIGDSVCVNAGQVFDDFSAVLFESNESEIVLQHTLLGSAKPFHHGSQP